MDERSAPCKALVLAGGEPGAAIRWVCGAR